MQRLERSLNVGWHKTRGDATLPIRFFRRTNVSNMNPNLSNFVSPTNPLDRRTVYIPIHTKLNICNIMTM